MTRIAEQECRAMASLDTTSRFSDPDAAFRLLLEAHREAGTAQSAALNARLVLLLANHIGDIDVLREAIARAKAAGVTTGAERREADDPR